MTKKLILVAGIWGVGKTYYSDNFIKEHPEYVLIGALPKIDDYIVELKKHDYVISDYYFRLDFNANRVKEICPVEIIVLFENPEVISYRQIHNKIHHHDTSVDIPTIIEVYKSELKELFDINSVKFIHSGTLQEYSYDNMISYLNSFNEPSEKRILEFIEYIKKQQAYDWGYHSVKLPFNIQIGKEGYAANEQTWDVIKNWIDWKGKRVLDLCAFHAAHCHQIIRAGGYPTACDMHNHATYSAVMFAHFNKLKFKIYHCDIDYNFPIGEYDVAMLFSVLHHLKDKDGVLRRMKKYPLCLFEINDTQVPMVERHFDIIKLEKSPKFKRLLLMCKPKEAKT